MFIRWQIISDAHCAQVWAIISGMTLINEWPSQTNDQSSRKNRHGENVKWKTKTVVWP